jgi:hypothetical protein
VRRGGDGDVCTNPHSRRAPRAVWEAGGHLAIQLRLCYVRIDSSKRKLLGFVAVRNSVLLTATHPAVSNTSV